MKSIFLLLLLLNIAYAGFQTVRIGTIDAHYQNTLSKEALLVLIEEIEVLFESQLGFNVFDYAEDGKAIDILYMAPSKKKKKLLRHIKKAQSLKQKIDTLASYIKTSQKSSELSRVQLNTNYARLNQSIEDLNAHIVTTQKTIESLSKLKQEAIQKDITQKKKTLQIKQSSLEKKKKKFNKNVATLKQKVRQYNLLIARYNRANRDIEKLSSTLTEIKGVTKGEIKTTYTSYDGQSNVKKTTHTDMQKIEIYNFENLQQLKVVLAHELGHLVGVQHINVAGALMHPLLQQEQLETLSLTYDDIQAFYKAFE